MPQGSSLHSLAQVALELGFTGAGLIFADEIVVEDELARLCVEPRCESYGLSPGCPPHVSGPKGFRRLLRDYHRALVLKIDLPTETLLSPQRREAARFLHENTAATERKAIGLGCGRAKAFCGGSCNKIFCFDKPNCRVLAEGGPCRHPDAARPSMSGFGLNVSRLMASAGWDLPRVMKDTDPQAVPMGNLVGLILLD